ncbi:MAG: hypothetical protein ACRDWA_07295 [Acidimicrobiia bacterium]
MLRRTERRLLKVLDELENLAEQHRIVEAELTAHTHINDDAQRDAALGIDRLEATATRNEVMRFMRLLAAIEARQKRLLEVRAKLTSQLKT